MVFLGFSDVLLDTKHRLAIPSKFRRNIDAERDGSHWVVVHGEPSNTLWLYVERDFVRLVEKGESSLIPGEDQRRFDQLYYPLGEAVEPDGQGRILIPERMVKEAGLEREVVICGVRDHLEIWPREAFMRHLGESKSRFHELHSRARDSYKDKGRQSGQGAGET